MLISLSLTGQWSVFTIGQQQTVHSSPFFQKWNGMANIDFDILNVKSFYTITWYAYFLDQNHIGDNAAYGKNIDVE